MQAHVNSSYDTQTLFCNYNGRWLSDPDYNVHLTLPNDVKDELLPLFKCEPVLCDHDPPQPPDPGCGIVEPPDIHTCADKQFPAQATVINKPSSDNMVQYETTVNYTCPSPTLKQYQIEYLKNNFTFDIPDAITPSTYIHDLQAYCEIDK